MDEQTPKPQVPTKSNQVVQQVVNLQRVYANSFGIGVSLSDLFVTLMINGRPSHQIFLAIPTAKELIKALQKGVEDYESKVSETSIKK